MRIFALLLLAGIPASCSGSTAPPYLAYGEIRIDSISHHEASVVIFLEKQSAKSSECVGANVMWNSGEARISFIRSQGDSGSEVQCPIEESEAGVQLVRIPTDHIDFQDPITLIWVSDLEDRNLGTFTRGPQDSE